jgi:quaternary ammonium compound-resistance protein SugE
MSWIILFAAGLLEIAWAVGLKHADGFSRPWTSAITVLLFLASLALLGLALRTIPLGTGYAVWTGIGTVGTVAVGMLWFGEPADPWRLACIGLILAGIVGLKLASPG